MTKKLFNSLGIYLLGFNDNLDKDSYNDMIQSIKYIDFDEWLKRENVNNGKNKMKKKKSKNIEILGNEEKKNFDINSLEEVLESNFEEIVMEMKNICYNSVIAIGESFYKDPTNYSEKYPDVTKFKEYVNDEFLKKTDDIINKKEKFIDGIYRLFNYNFI